MELISSALLKTALQHLRTALTADCQQDYNKAVQCYMKGVPLLLDLAKEEDLSLQAKEILKTKCQLYLERIEVIRIHLEAGNEVPPNTTADPNRPQMKNFAEDSKEYLQNLTELPKWSLEEVKVSLQVKGFLEKNVILPLLFPGWPDRVTRIKKGILLYGVPGSGKTMLLCAVATAVSCPVFRIVPCDLISRWQGVECAVQRVKDIFTFVSQNQPCILCLDDLDVFCQLDADTGDSILKNVQEELAMQLMNLPADSQVTVIAATQQPWKLGGTMRRRFDRRFYLNLPTDTERAQICRQLLTNDNHELSEDDLSRVGQLTQGFTGADLSVLIRSCLMVGLRQIQKATHFCKFTVTSGENAGKEMLMPCEPDTPNAIGITFQFLNPECLWLSPLSLAMVENELKQLKPSCGDQELQKMDQWHEEFGQND